MSRDRWQEVSRLLDVALSLPPEERDAFLNGSCTDPQVREELLENGTVIGGSPIDEGDENDDSNDE